MVPLLDNRLAQQWVNQLVMVSALVLVPELAVMMDWRLVMSLVVWWLDFQLANPLDYW
jgi:hypothetical protein